MKLLVLAVVLATIQASSPIPRQTTDEHATPSKKKADSSENDPVVQNLQPLSPEANRNTNPSSQINQEYSVRVTQLPLVNVATDGWTKSYVILTGALALIGLGGVCAALRTLRGIDRQTRAIEDSVRAMRTSDRAWLLVEDIQIPFDRLTVLEAAARAENQDARYFTVRFRNYGHSPAFVYARQMHYSFGGSSDTPPYPAIYSREFTLARMERIIPPFVNNKTELTDAWVDGCFLDGPLQWLTTPQFAAIRSGNSFLWAYGIVKYRDVYGQERETKLLAILNSSNSNHCFIAAMAKQTPTAADEPVNLTA